MAIDLSLKCQVEGCSKVYYCKGYCRVHYERVRYHGNTDRLKAERGKGWNQHGYNVVMIEGVVKPRHIWLAEKALGKELPEGTEIHHFDGNRGNNGEWNLIVCPDRAYHRLIEQRTRAYEACGNANYRKCHYCKKYDDPSVMRITRDGGSHFECKKEYDKNYHQQVSKPRMKSRPKITVEQARKNVEALLDLRDGRAPTIRHILEANKE